MALTSVLLGVGAGAATGVTFNVSPGDDLQLALDGAAATAGNHTILFAPGTYSLAATACGAFCPPLTVGSSWSGRTLILKGGGGAAGTILDGDGSSTLIEILAGASGAHVIVEGLTLRNGGDGAIQANLTELTVRDSVFSDNVATLQGGAIRMVGASSGAQESSVLLHVENTTFRNNLSLGDAGAVFVFRTSAEVTGSTFTDNEATGEANGILNPPVGSGGAFYLSTAGSAHLTGSVFKNNVSAYAGGGVRVVLADATIRDSLFDGNTAFRDAPGDTVNKGDGGAVQLQTFDKDVTCIVEDNTLVGNTAGGKGGGIHAFLQETPSVLQIRGNRIEGNSAEGGGGINSSDCAPGGTPPCSGAAGSSIQVIEDNELVDNHASNRFGGAHFGNFSDLIFQRNRVRGNMATTNDPGLFVAGVRCVVVARNEFDSNASSGSAGNGALRLKDLRACPSSSRSAVVENNLFHGNSGYNVGALVVTAGEPTDVVGNTFVDNQSVYGVGATVWVASAARLWNNVIARHDLAVDDNYGIRFKGSGFTAEAFFNDFHQNANGLVKDSDNSLGHPSPPAGGTYASATALNGASRSGDNSELDPGFADPAAGDLRLNASSLLVDQGACDLFSVPVVDYHGDSRPMGSTCDIGADEVSLHLLMVTTSGGGCGEVSSDPAGIQCGSDCEESFLGGTAVTLTATPCADSEFREWGGDPDCGDGVVAMSAARSCDALFDPKPVLRVFKDGSGTGTVSSSPGGINCGGDCEQHYASGSLVDLTPLAGVGSAFASWSGTADCADGSLSMSADRNCTATFLLEHQLYVVLSGAGSGTVTSVPGGVDCGADCTETYVEGTSVNLSPTPSLGSEFVGWSGDLDCSDGQVGILTDTSCTATFDPCSSPSMVQLGPPAQPVDTVELYEACNVLRGGSGGFSIASPGYVTFRAGNRIEIQDGFSVGADAEFVAVIGPP